MYNKLLFMLTGDDVALQFRSTKFLSEAASCHGVPGTKTYVVIPAQWFSK
jgi:hypothetical protein